MNTDSKQELKTMITKICKQLRTYYEIDCLNTFQRFLSTQHEIKTSFTSSFGIDFDNKVKRINHFWFKSFMATLIGQDPFFYWKFLSNIILGEKLHEKIKSAIRGKSEEEKIPPESLQFTPEDYNIVGSMFIILMAGLIEDYLRNLNQEVRKLLEERTKEDNLNDLRNKFARGSLLSKIWVIFEELNLEEIEIKELLERGNCGQIIESFNEFLVTRHKIAHTGRIIDLSELDQEINRLSKLLFDYVVDWFDSQVKTPRFPKSEYKEILEKSMPFIIFLFAIYMKVVPLLTILDHSFNFVHNSS
ncbi:MAG: hypothetical protein ACFFAO_21065 [Candidatus Hermodarchaeota archaeon]